MKDLLFEKKIENLLEKGEFETAQLLTILISEIKELNEKVNLWVIYQVKQDELGLSERQIRNALVPRYSKSGRKLNGKAPLMESEIRKAFEANPGKNMRFIQQYIGVSKATLLKYLNLYGIYDEFWKPERGPDKGKGGGIVIKNRLKKQAEMENFKLES